MKTSHQICKCLIDGALQIDYVLVLLGYQNLVYQILNYLQPIPLTLKSKDLPAIINCFHTKIPKNGDWEKEKNKTALKHSPYALIINTQNIFPHLLKQIHKKDVYPFHIAPFLIKFDLFSQILSVSLISSYPISQSLLSYMNKTHKNKNNPEKKRIKITKKPRRRLVWCMKIAIF